MKHKQIATLLMAEITNYSQARMRKNHELSTYHLGRAHILSQYRWFHHLYVHFLMFEYARTRKDWKEVGGQILRIVVTVPGHLLKRLPIGNTGWSNVHLMEKMPLPKDFSHLFDDLKIS